MGEHIVAFSDLESANLLEVGAGRPRSAGLDRFPLPILRVADVAEGRVHPLLPTGAPPTDSQAMGPKTSKPGDVVLTTKGTVGRAAIMPAGGVTFAYSPQLCYFRPIANGPLRARYLYYWFKSEEFWNQADALKGQTDMADFISLSDIYSIKMRLPSIEEQMAAIGILGALDDKITSNEKQILLIDECIRANFQAIQGETVALSAIARDVKVQVEPSSIDQDALYFGLEHLPRRRMWSSEVGKASDVTSTKFMFESGDTLFGKLRPYFHKVVSACAGGICSTDIMVVRANDPSLAGLVLAVCASDDAIKTCSASAEGTRMPRTRWNDLGSVSLPWPGLDDARRFSQWVLANSALAHSLIAEMKKLRQTRDELLPLLLSGKIVVRAAEEVVEDVI